MEIRRAVPADADIIAPLFDQYRTFYGQEPDKDGARTFLHDRLINGQSVIFLAMEGEEPAGFAQLYPTYSSVSMRGVWTLNDLFVRPEHRKKSIGKKLMEASHQLAKETGSKGLQLETGTDNKPAQNLYESLGWKRVTEFVNYEKSV